MLLNIKLIILSRDNIVQASLFLTIKFYKIQSWKQGWMTLLVEVQLPHYLIFCFCTWNFNYSTPLFCYIPTDMQNVWCTVYTGSYVFSEYEQMIRIPVCFYSYKSTENNRDTHTYSSSKCCNILLSKHKSYAEEALILRAYCNILIPLISLVPWAWYDINRSYSYGVQQTGHVSITAFLPVHGRGFTQWQLNSDFHWKPLI